MKIGKHSLSIIFWLDSNPGVKAAYILPFEDLTVIVKALFVLCIYLSVYI